MFLRREGGGSAFERPTARYSVPPGEVREPKGKGETAEIPLAINTLGGTAGRCCSHINQGGGGQVTEPGGRVGGGGREKPRGRRFERAEEVELGLSSPRIHLFPSMFTAEAKENNFDGESEGKRQARAE